MLIRTQDKRNLIELQNINISIGKYVMYNSETGRSNYYNIETNIGVLGKYSSEEKAIRVLDMIEERYHEPIYINDQGSGEYAKYEQKVFHMPKDNEV